MEPLKKRTKPIKYTPAGVTWIMENLSTIPRKEMALHFKSTYKAFNKFLSLLRREGHDIPFSAKGPGRKVPIGTITERNDRGRTRRIQKTESGWVDITNKGKEPQKTGRKPKEKSIPCKAPKKGPSQRAHHDRKPPVDGAHFKKPEKVFTTRKVVDGPIVVVLNDSKHTRLTAIDEAHAARIRKKYAYLEKPLVARIRGSG